jgi:hypothetical protein
MNVKHSETGKHPETNMSVILTNNNLTLKRGFDERTYLLKPKKGWVSKKVKCFDQNGKAHEFSGINQLYYQKDEDYAKNLLDLFIVELF